MSFYKIATRIWLPSSLRRFPAATFRPPSPRVAPPRPELNPHVLTLVSATTSTLDSALPVQKGRKGKAGALDDKLREEHHDYKAASEKVGQDKKLYKKRVKELEHTKDGNKELAALAAAVSKSAKTHAEKRREFNERYKDVLVAKGVYEGHVKAANDAEAGSKKYAKRAQVHQQEDKSSR
ncbi:hypothetical protein B0I37DRAFT_375865 [Chaetomium sp. MPI-CAGE-AT-0009]|nr:hypothetical protein B0I37DRAFT_375865 [Chaetomium sp. MPI-CAGE-AT-0009]